MLTFCYVLDSLFIAHLFDSKKKKKKKWLSNWFEFLNILKKRKLIDRRKYFKNNDNLKSALLNVAMVNDYQNFTNKRKKTLYL
jgi:hypothetical protein